MTQSAASISWTVSQPATGQVEYGRTTAYGSVSVLEASFVYTSHVQALAGLTLGVTYHYRVRSQNQLGVLVTSGDYIFTTQASATTPTPTTPTPTPTPTTPTPTPTTTSSSGLSVPASIDSTGASDASAALNAWIASVPDGSTIVFKAGGVYRLDHGIKLSNRHHLTFNGDGATLRANGSAGVHTDTPFALWGYDSYITIRNFTIIGNNATGLFTPSQGEDQMGVTIFGAAHVEIANNTIKNTWGDGVYVTESVPVSGQPGIWSDDIWVHDNTFQSIGRMGIALIAVTNATFEHNSFDRLSLDVLDIEPDLSWEGAINVIFRNNTIGTYAHSSIYRSHMFSSSGAATAVVRDITVTGNVVTGGRMVNANNSAGGVTARNQVSGRRQNFTFTNNTSTVAGPGYMLIFERVDGLILTGNVQPLTSGSFAYLNNDTGTVYP